MRCCHSSMSQLKLLNLGHGWVITSYQQLIQFLFHDLITVNFCLLKSPRLKVTDSIKSQKDQRIRETNNLMTFKKYSVSFNKIWKYLGCMDIWNVLDIKCTMMQYLPCVLVCMDVLVAGDTLKTMSPYCCLHYIANILQTTFSLHFCKHSVSHLESYSTEICSLASHKANNKSLSDY